MFHWNATTAVVNFDTARTVIRLLSARSLTVNRYRNDIVTVEMIYYVVYYATTTSRFTTRNIDYHIHTNALEIVEKPERDEIKREKNQ